MTTKQHSKNEKDEWVSVYWMRQDLRLADNPALTEAIDSGSEVYLVYIWAPREEAPWVPGGASRVWLHQSLEALQEEIEAAGSRLHIFESDSKHSSEDILMDVIEQTGATGVYWNRRYEPTVIERDDKIREKLEKKGLTVETFKANLLLEPWEIMTKEDKPYQVFTPFWRACVNRLHPDPPLKKPAALPENKKKKLTGEVTLKSLELLPKIKWDTGIRESWEPGEKGAVRQFKKFLKEAAADYGVERNHPAVEGVSRLSPHLHFGEISPRTVWYMIREAAQDKKMKEAAQVYLREIGWREFSHHLLFHFPDTPEKPLRPEFSHFPWHRAGKNLTAWQKGKTGYPIVDAGMRELWHTGVMHNRVRMITASFLIKHLLLPWQKGAEWFWDTLVDADLAQNTLGWQWVAGCGADAAPYFRIFNPTLQGEKFDPDGDYVRRWVPELAELDKKYIHTPWLAPEDVLTRCGITLGEDYPRPLVDHGKARAAALEAYEEVKAHK